MHTANAVLPSKGPYPVSMRDNKFEKLEIPQIQDLIHVNGFKGVDARVLVAKISQAEAISSEQARSRGIVESALLAMHRQPKEVQ